MHPDDARDLFSDALEDELSAADRAAFMEALAGDAELAEEYRDFCDAVSATRALRRAPVPPVDLLEGARTRLKSANRGRFYRDRFADEKRASRLFPTVLGVVFFVLIGVAVASLLYLDVLGAAPPSKALFLV